MTDVVEKLFQVNLVDGVWQVSVTSTVVLQVEASIPGAVGNGLVTGGTAGQVLMKDTGTDFDVSWATIIQVPAGGTVGQVLTKDSGDDFDVVWETPPTALVASVFGRTGAVVATSGDYSTAQITESGNLFYTEGRVSANTDVAANTSARHSHSNSAQLALVTDGDHDVRTDNPHSVTKTQVGLGNVPNLDTTPEAIEIAFDGGGAALTVDKKLDVVAKCAMTITGWTLLADQSGSVEIGVWKDTYANFPPTVADVLVSPSITTAEKNQATGLTLAVAAGDVLRFNVNSATTIQRATLALTGVRA